MLKNKQQTPILPGATIGIIGGGQLGRMMGIAAREMGYKVAVLDPTPKCPTAQISDEHIIAAYDDMDALKELVKISDVVTYEFENVDLSAAIYIEEQGKLPQGAYALEITQNREKEKQLIKKLGLPTPEFTIVTDGKSCEAELQNISLPAVIKTCSGGYDGKGQLKIETEADIQAAVKFADENGTCIIEQWIPFEKEISIVFTRSQSGGIAFFPIAENKHKDHILDKTNVPASISDVVSNEAITAATILASEMNVVGTFTIEMFVKGDKLYINEMAPRPHNSGHYTIEACNISQFAQHIRALCGLPLMDIKLEHHSIMVNVLGENLDATINYMQTYPEGFVHLYGKAKPQEKRKMGHITFIGDTLEEIEEYVRKFEEV